jgi:hypothetical protein
MAHRSTSGFWIAANASAMLTIFAGVNSSERPDKELQVERQEPS